MVELLNLFQTVAQDEDSTEFFSFNRLDDFRTALESIRQTYSRPCLSSGICQADYSLYHFRWAYLMRYGLLHTKLVKESLDHCESLNPWISSLEETSSLKICSLGGGPGIDSLGLLEFLCESSEELDMDTFKIEVTTVDWDMGWQETNKAIMKKGLEDYLECDGSLSTTFIKTDLLEALSPRVMKEVKSADVILMIKVLSALRHDEEGCETLLQDVFNNMKQSAIFIYIDNNYWVDFSFVQDLAERENMSILTSLSRFDCRAFPNHERRTIEQFCKENYGISPVQSLLTSVLIVSRNSLNEQTNYNYELQSNNRTINNLNEWTEENESSENEWLSNEVQYEPEEEEFNENDWILNDNQEWTDEDEFNGDEWSSSRLQEWTEENECSENERLSDNDQVETDEDEYRSSNSSQEDTDEDESDRTSNSSQETGEGESDSNGSSNSSEAESDEEESDEEEYESDRSSNSSQEESDEEESESNISSSNSQEETDED